MNRDPIEEQGGLNLYGFAGNSPLNLIDPYGQSYLPIQIPSLIESGFTAKEIADMLGISVTMVMVYMGADDLSQQVDQAIGNWNNNAKGRDPCEKAKDALRQALQGIQNAKATIAKHKGYIADPSSYPKPLKPIYIEHPEWVISTWQKQIRAMEKRIEIAEKAIPVLEEAVKKACRCWYNPFTWF